MWKHVRKKRSRAAVEASERYAEGLLDAGEVTAFHAAAFAAFEEAGGTSKTVEEQVAAIAADVALLDAREAARSGVAAAELLAHFAAYGPNDELPYSDERQARYEDRKATEHAAQCGLLRELFGNPFRRIRIGSAWLTSDVLALARGIYEDRAFDRMPILADALQDAGCNNDDILSHCREPGEHVRGCWVVDLLLGKR